MKPTQNLKFTPKQLFLIDAGGAILSAFLLGVILVKLEHLFGIPRATLYLLAALPCCFALYDLLCYFFAREHINSLLKGIAYANILYCCISICLAFYHVEVVTSLGWLYIVGEVLIVVLLSILELKVASE